jgi:hypothetical protein
MSYDPKKIARNIFNFFEHPEWITSIKNEQDKRYVELSQEQNSKTIMQVLLKILEIP